MQRYASLDARLREVACQAVPSVAHAGTSITAADQHSGVASSEEANTVEPQCSATRATETNEAIGVQTTSGPRTAGESNVGPGRPYDTSPSQLQGAPTSELGLPSCAAYNVQFEVQLQQLKLSEVKAREDAAKAQMRADAALEEASALREETDAASRSKAAQAEELARCKAELSTLRRRLTVDTTIDEAGTQATADVGFDDTSIRIPGDANATVGCGASGARNADSANWEASSVCTDRMLALHIHEAEQTNALQTALQKNVELEEQLARAFRECQDCFAREQQTLALSNQLRVEVAGSRRAAEEAMQVASEQLHLRELLQDRANVLEMKLARMRALITAEASALSDEESDSASDVFFRPATCGTAHRTGGGRD
uniref:Uncharacterized protein n=1 Tax=Coccolithus braarudii TaxID=221442 RepID=A0A7S0LBN7_9EUKA|mmetsp:Transcript_29073/g.62537  ORF Transcript_29073/g.62537 Transcript_29073/m.62537 type:complete len:373 (+) Transcript_29073:74-1192(+)|eukprot:CAMPEP_0183352224 /NCGR_PEP_ID=MMETSP0164_2-20130417/28468_1 /TAXON_ID=221442 /ORGANISM="Coccolithus pelagicus ssp braarudi, Strain PLY182g" /LENGTH=372 /DNA_ID=CAMNT_0025524605 /DNA_START=71 /DNA_END=1189 /DNA_ORIENTATION=-